MAQSYVSHRYLSVLAPVLSTNLDMCNFTADIMLQF